VTDGVTEAIGPNGRPLGVSGLVELIQSCVALPASERLKRIIGAINVGRQVPTDDVTLLIIEAQMS